MSVRFAKPEFYSLDKVTEVTRDRKVTTKSARWMVEYALEYV